jgi:O-antigen ligase
MTRFVDRAIAAGLLVAVIFTTLAFGAVEAWSVAVFELIAVGLLALWVVKAIKQRSLTMTVPPAAWPLAAFISLGLAQSAAFTDSSGKIRSLSMDVEATRGAVTVIFFLFVLFLLAGNFFASRERLRMAANFLALYGLALAMFAVIQYFTWDGKFYWIRPNTSSASPFGPFVNHNHFAGYMEMLIPIPLALITTRSFRSEVNVFYAFAAAIMGLALVTSLSRGGMIALAAEMIFIAVWSGRTRGGGRDRTRLSRIRKAGAVGAVSVAILVGIIWIGPDQIFGRIANSGKQGETFDASRGRIWKDTLEMIRAHPVSGVGLGAFETVYPIYSGSSGALRVEFAHNDYLQVLADGGVIAGTIAVVFLVLLARAFYRGLQAPDPLIRGIALGGGAGIFALLVHSLMDFNLQIPSNTLLFLFLSAAVGSAASQADKVEQRSLVAGSAQISARATA